MAEICTPQFMRGREAVIGYPVTWQGVRTRVLEALGPGRPVVCLHGAGSRADRWTPVVPGLAAAGFKVFAIDLPGHGFADKGSDFDYSSRGFASYICGVLNELGLTEIVLVGTSLGGHVAAHVALDHPGLVSELVLVGTVGLVPLPDEQQTPPQVLADASEEAVHRKLNFLVADADQVTPDWVHEESSINSSAGAREALTAVGEFLLNECNNDLVAQRLVDAGLAARTLVVWGENDRWTPLSMGEAIRDALPGAGWITMPGCGHAPYFEDPERFVQILCDRLGVSAHDWLLHPHTDN